MDKEKNKISYFSAFLREFATIFTLTVLLMSLIGKLIIGYIPDAQNMSSIFVLGATALPYDTILQIAGFAFIMAAVSCFLFSEYIAARLSFFWRYFLFFLASLFTTLIFTIIFKWFPINNIQVWLFFIPAFFISFITAIGLSLLLLKLEDKKYNRLLENYKSRSKK